jgi:hypothetical protein
MRLRVRTLLVFAALALAVRGRAPWPAPASAEGLAEMLGHAVFGTVRPTEIAWEPSPGIVAEILTGRGVLFLANEGAGPRDLYRASVRLTFEGRPVSIGDVRDLTSTPLGDEQDLVVSGDHAAFATSSFGKVESVTLLDTRGKPEVLGATWLDKVTGWITNRQETGSSVGLGRIDVVLDVPQPRVALAFDPKGRLAIGGADGRVCKVDPDTGAIFGPLAAHATAEPALLKKPILWAVDTVRAEIGPEAVTWLEEKVYGARDYLRRGRYAWFGARDEALPPASPGRPAAAPRALDASGVRADEAGWPPPAIVSIWKNADREEGQWEPVTFVWMKRLGQGAPPYYMKTTIRPDAERPYAKVVVVAMDMRQLDLDMEGGVEDPKSLTGVHGAGKIPRDPAIINRVVGAFNGAFKTTHGEYGMMVAGKVLLPPRPNAATVVVTKDRRIGLGTWGSTGAIPEDIASLRQNLDPLVEDGKLMPSGRTQWGFQLAGTSLFAMRSGLCTSAGGYLYYLWGEELSGQTLAKAMLQAGCTYGMHLDMNLHHTAFVFASVRNIATKDYDAKILTPVMEVMP